MLNPYFLVFVWRNALLVYQELHQLFYCMMKYVYHVEDHIHQSTKQDVSEVIPMLDKKNLQILFQP